MRPWAARDGAAEAAEDGVLLTDPRGKRGSQELRDVAGGQGEVPTWSVPRCYSGGRGTQEQPQPLLYRALRSRVPGPPSVHQEDTPRPQGSSGTQQLALMSGTSAIACQQARHLRPSSVQGTPSHLMDSLRHQARSPEHLPLQTQAGLHPQDPMVWDKQTTEMEGDLRSLPGGGGICMELKRSKTPVSWSAGRTRALGRHSGQVRAPWG